MTTANSGQQVLNLDTLFAGLSIQNYTVMFFDCFFFKYMFKLNETVTELFLPSSNSRHCTTEPIDQGRMKI